MSEYDEFDDEQNEQPTPKDLRTALQKANKKAEELAKQVAELTKANTENRLSDLMREKNVPPKIQRWIKRDDVEATPEAIQKWLDENGEDFGYKPEGEAPSVEAGKVEQSTAEEVPVLKGVLTEEDINSYLRFQQMGQAPSADQAIDPVRGAVDRVAANINGYGQQSFDDAVSQLRASGVPIESAIQ